MIFADKKFARDKHLLRLERELNRLSRAQWQAPIVPLEHPYQRGWIKTFRLREDTKRHPERQVFEVVLSVVNQRIVSRRRDFIDRVGDVIELHPRVLGAREWRNLAWPARYQRLFAHGNWPDDSAHGWKRRCWNYRKPGFKLMTIWWLEELILPHMITHQRVDLPEVRSRIAEIENHLRHRLGWERLRNLQGRRSRYWSDPQPPALLRAEISRTESSSQPD